uniref:GATOR complex protein NPRL3 n=1 Tax=Parascaris univalens TaxID=6257 RepID=A0A915CA90_PARUN
MNRNDCRSIISFVICELLRSRQAESLLSSIRYRQTLLAIT